MWTMSWRQNGWQRQAPYMSSLRFAWLGVAPPNLLGSSHLVEIGLTRATQMGGSVKAEGLGDGEWANHRQAALDDATQNSTLWDEPNSFDGADSMEPVHPRPHGQTSLPVPPEMGYSRINTYVCPPSPSFA